jgi:excisionase family DNA binding protein
MPDGIRVGAKVSNVDRLLDAEEVAELLHLPVSWVREATRAGRLPCVPLGRYRRYRREEIDAWVEQQANGSAESR